MTVVPKAAQARPLAVWSTATPVTMPTTCCGCGRPSGPPSSPRRVVVSGRADVILDMEDGLPTALALLDYKTATDGDPAVHELQLQVYTDTDAGAALCSVRGPLVYSAGGR